MKKNILILLLLILGSQLLTGCVVDSFFHSIEPLAYGIIAIAGVGIIGGLILSSDNVKEHREEVTIDGKTHIFHDPSKDEYTPSDYEFSDSAIYSVAVVGYLFGLYYLIKVLKGNFQIYNNLLVIIITGAVYLGLCYVIHQYVHNVWKYILWACWGILALWIVVELVVWLWNTAV